METAEYEIMYHHEEHHWWYVGLRDLVLAEVARLARGRGPLTILDAGCGTGKILELCRRHRAFGLELFQEAFRFLRRRGLSNVARASIVHVPFADASFDLVVSLDVLCCLDPPGDRDSLRELGRVLKPGGTLILNLPAYEFLRSEHDAAVHTRTRYTRPELRGMIDQAGLRVEKICYRNTFLLPAAAGVRLAQRLFRKRAARPRSDLRALPGPLNRALTLPLFLENRLYRLGVRLPFGLSVYCVARKPG